MKINLTINGTISIPTGTVIRATGTVTINGTINVTHSGVNTRSLSTMEFNGIAASPRSGANGGVARSAGQLRGIVTPGFLGGESASANAPTAANALGGGVLVIRAGGGITIAATGAINAGGDDASTLSRSRNPSRASW